MTTIGVDLGGTKVLAAVVHRGEVRSQAKRLTPDGGPDAIVATIAEMVDELGGADRIGMGVPGQVTGADGVVVGAPNLPGFDKPVPLGRLVAEATKTRVVASNDVNVATAAEHRAGAGKGYDDVLGVFMGTGVGGGLVLGGRVRDGATGLAGEIGHTTYLPGGRQCACGLTGHVEAYAGRAAMEAEARRRHGAGEPTALVELAGEGRMRSAVFAAALDAGDAMTVSLLDEAVDAVAVGIAAAIMLLDLEVVVVGGGVADKLGPAFLGRIEQAVRSRLFPKARTRIVPAALGDLAGVIGAAHLAH